MFMTREQIEKESHDYISEVYADGGYFLPAYEEEVRDGFIEGAQWRINSVWQKPSQNGDELVAGRMVIAKFKEGYIFGKFDEGEIYKRTLIFLSRSFIEYPLSEVLEYAYLDDLLPERKEETE